MTIIIWAGGPGPRIPSELYHWLRVPHVRILGRGLAQQPIRQCIKPVHQNPDNFPIADNPTRVPICTDRRSSARVQDRG